MQKLTWTSILWSPAIEMASAKVAIKPDAAFHSLVKSREELEYVYKTFLVNKDYDGMRDYLLGSSLNMNNYEENATALLTSKQLDAESKMAIGTIRRYGVGADVIISYGGLRSELDTNESPDYVTVSKALQRTMDSLDEVIAICKSNGFEVK
jgi:galactitol-specific phosphotransferase system IIB component